jgi:hypothetical protein
LAKNRKSRDPERALEHVELYQHFDTYQYNLFLLTRLGLYMDLYHYFTKKSDPASLSAIAFLSYMLSSLVHQPNSESKWKPIITYCNNYRNSDNDLLFLPSLFKMDDEGTITCTEVLNDKQLQKIFSHMTIDIDTMINVNYSVQSENRTT